ncbi:DUF1573 domain-containing protein [Bacteroidetes/Chlorobi group bacterium Naka2016]|nr:MAG: DUF1573 domain-containing protein [Bacteroidetes/Chlorobi group bacterium Naka2016]
MRILSFLVFVLMSFNLLSAPKFRFENGDTYDFGKVRDTEEPLKAKVRIFNDGDDTLKILYVKPGCGCTAAPLDKYNIEPNGFATMDVSLMVPKSPGVHTKSIYFKTNDPTKEETYFYLKAEYLPPIKFFPDSKVMASNLLIGDTSTFKLVMKNTSGDTLIIKEPKTEPQESIFTNLRQDLVLKPDEDFTLEVKIAPNTIGNFSGKIKFKTTLPDLPRVEIPVFGIVSGFKK